MHKSGRLEHVDGGSGNQPSNTQLVHGALTRREFLRIAGVAGTAVGLGAGLGGTLLACGSTAATTNSTTARSTSTTAGSTSTTVGPTSSTASAPSVTTGPETGRVVRVGLIEPLTGYMATMSVPMDFVVPIWEKSVAGGVVLGDAKKHEIQILRRDTQSDTNRSSQVTADLIMNEKIDMAMAYGTPDVVNPAADQCEANGIPMTGTFDPYESFVFGRGGTPDKPFKWTFALSPGIAEFMATDIDMINKIPSNKVAAMLYPNNADGQAFADEKSGYPVLMKASGYTQVNPGLYNSGAEDFTSYINAFKKAGCEVLVTSAPPSDFTNFWKQCLQQGFHPKAVCTALAMMFPEAINSVGAIAENVLAECAFHPTYPYKSSLDGMSAKDLCASYEESTGRQYTGALTEYSHFEWALDILKRSTDVDNKESIVKALLETKMDTMTGPIDFTQPVDPAGPRNLFNVYKQSMAGIQWVKGTGKWMFEQVVVSNVKGPDLPIGGQPKPMSYS
jgi:branched-chain amino acid transport system substrate-binding protein